MKGQACGVGAALLLAGWVGLAGWAARADGPMNDEMFDLQCGERLWRTGRCDLTEDPPRLNPLLSTLPWRALHVSVPAFPPDPPASWPARWRIHQVNVDRYAHALDLFYRSGNPPGRLLTSARLVAIVAMLVCGVVVVLWARAAYGPAGGLVAAAGFAGHPLLLTWGHFSKEDGMAAVTVTLALWAFVRWSTGGGIAWAVAAGFALGAALATKLSALLLLPVLLTAGGVAVRRATRPGAWRDGMVIAAVAWLFLAALYGFRGPFLNRPVVPELVAYGRPPAPVEFAYRWMPVPDGYARAFLLTMSRARSGDFAVPFAGEMFPSARWWMMPWAMMVKTPVGFLAVGAFFAASFWRRPPNAMEWTILGTAIIYLGVTSVSPLFHGSRYLVPILPGLCVLAGRTWELWPARHALLALALLAGVAEAWARAPQFTAFANLLVRGPGRAAFWTAVDDLDLGQDLGRLGEAMRRDPAATLLLSYSGNAPPDAAGLRYQDGGTLQVAQRYASAWVGPDRPSRELFAMSVTHIVDRRRQPGWGWLDEIEPCDRAGRTIWIYDITRSAAVHEGLARWYLQTGWRAAFRREIRRLRVIEGPGSPRARHLEAAARPT